MQLPNRTFRRVGNPTANRRFCSSPKQGPDRFFTGPSTTKSNTTAKAKPPVAAIQAEARWENEGGALYPTAPSSETASR
jgi:hypothetical protein